MNPTPPRIAYVVKRYPRFSETFIVNEILAHEAAGHALEIFSLYPPNDTHFQDALASVRAPVTYLAAEGLRAQDFLAELQRADGALPGSWSALACAGGAEAREVFQAAWLARLARARQLCLLHAHFATTATTVARLAARFAGLPYTFTAHAKDIFHESADGDDLQRKLGDAARVITVSDFNRDYLHQHFGNAARKVGRLYNGIDLDRFTFASPRLRSPNIVAVGRLIPKKGFSVLIDACAILARQDIEFACDILGHGELEGALRQQIQQLGLTERVRLLGPRPQSEVIAHMRQAAVFAAPCTVGADGDADGLPTVLLEAMALGTPCVSTDVTGIPEVIGDGTTGLAVGQQDAPGLAVALKRLLHDSELRAALAGRARELIEREFDIHRNAAVQWSWFMAACKRGPSEAPAPPTGEFVPSIQRHEFTLPVA